MRRSTGATALLITGGVGLVLLGVRAADAQPAPQGVTASTLQGVRLPANPALVPGEQVVLVAAGFAPGADTTVRRLGSSDAFAAPADATGHARLIYAVPALGPGSVTLVFVGPPAQTRGPWGSAPVPMPSTAPATGGGGNLVVTVPLLDDFTYHVDPPASGSSGGSGIEGVHASRSAQAGTAVVGLAGTGTDAAALLAAGALAIASGLGIELLARRRRADHSEPGPDELAT
jgi:hypothetical protein